MSALDKINDMIVRIQSGDEEFIAIFEEGFKKFEEEYDKETMMIIVEEMVGKLFTHEKQPIIDIRDVYNHIFCKEVNKKHDDFKTNSR